MGRFDLDRALAPRFAVQAGHVSRPQVLSVGGTDAHIRWRVATGRWERPYPGVYALAGSPTHTDGERWAAHLAVGPASALSHESAGVMWTIDHVREDGLVLSVPHGAHPRVRSLTLHQPTDLARDVVTYRGLPVTSPARTLFDLGTVLPHAAHVGAVEGALVTRLVTPHRLSVAARRLVRPRKPGARAFAATLSEVFEGHAPPESDLERLAGEILAEAEITEFVRQSSRPGGERGRVDFLIGLARLIVEADGRSWHARFESMRADRERDLAHAEEGYLTIRIMWESAVHDRARVVVGLRRTYQRRLAEQGLAA